MAETIVKKEAEIRKTYRPSDDELKTLQHVYTRKQQMGDKRAEMEPIWDRAEKAWECHRPARNADDWTSDIYVPMTTSIVESMLSEIINQELLPYAVERGSEDSPRALVVNNMLQYTWDVAKSDVAEFDIIKDALVCGTGIGQEYYWKQERDITLPNGQKKRVTEFDDCYLEPVKLQDFYVDEKARGFFGPYAAEDCIRRYVMDYDAFRNMFQGDIWDPKGNAKYVRPGGKTDYFEFFKPPQRMDHSREIEVLWYWNKPLDLLVIVANDVLVKMGPNPYAHKQLPFARALDIKRTHQFYGKGEAQLLESLQEETNTLRRMIIDRNHLDIDKPVFTSDALTLEEEDTIARPHGVISVGDVNQIKFPEYSDLPSSVFSSLEMINDDKIRVTGMDERQQGVSAAGTATEAAILKEATLKRINLKIWQIKNDFLVDVGRLRVANIMQFYSQPKLEKIVGEKGTEAYRSKLMQVASKGNLVSDGTDDFEAKYRNIRIKDAALSVADNGMVSQTPTKGFTFFEARPEYFMPVNGGFDIRYKATSSMPISRPLYQQKVLEMYDRLIQNPTVDPWKLANTVLESQEFNADDFKYVPPQQQPGQGGDQTAQLQKLVELAGVENEEMLKGTKIGPTPYSSPVHTEIHIEFMKSKRFKEELPPDRMDIVEMFKAHVEGELQAQAQRQSGGGPGAMDQGGMPPQGGQAPAAGAASGQNVEGAATMPAMNQGGGQMASGMRGSEAGVQTGGNG